MPTTGEDRARGHWHAPMLTLLPCAANSLPLERAPLTAINVSGIFLGDISPRSL